MLMMAALLVRPAPVNAYACHPWAITDSDDAGCGQYFPRYHPKNAMPLAHNNDANAPFEFGGVSHLFMQAYFPGVAGWTVGAIGLGHLASRWVSLYWLLNVWVSLTSRRRTPV
jgi:hypothetical protein